jgi:hypothetical protein
MHCPFHVAKVTFFSLPIIAISKTFTIFAVRNISRVYPTSLSAVNAHIFVGLFLCPKVR